MTRLPISRTTALPFQHKHYLDLKTSTPGLIIYIFEQIYKPLKFSHDLNYNTNYFKVLLNLVCRWKLLQLGLDDQYKKLNEVRSRAELPTTQDFLAVAVHYPWARAVSQHKVPYYIK